AADAQGILQDAAELWPRAGGAISASADGRLGVEFCPTPVLPLPSVPFPGVLAAVWSEELGTPWFLCFGAHGSDSRLSVPERILPQRLSAAAVVRDAFFL